MTWHRVLVLLLGPVPIVAGSLGITAWWRGGARAIVSGNHVLRADEPRSAPAAAVADVPLGDPAVAEKCPLAAAALRRNLGDECALLVRAPFVLAGDLTERELQTWHEATIAPAARALARSYFRTAPTAPITILLFRGEESYRRYARHLFHDVDVSVYGYYRPAERTLVMNIGTGGGTLVHELTHALIDFDFPNVPDWFNEGLASLHEQCRFRPNETGLEGLPNWRLPKLQEALRADRLRPLEDLFAADDFRGADVGLNYAQARYFCLLLQERGQLSEFYRRLRAAQRDDPRGTATAAAVLGNRPWETVNREFREFVLALKF